MSGNQLAFEGAEGFGANTVGGRGGQIVKVTNLNDDGVGSLRWALEDVSGPRTVVFEVNGTITLKSQILIDNPNVTIAGQTALGDGITIAGSRIRVKADEVIIRGLKFRPGDGPVGTDAGDRDGLFIGTTDFRIDNVIVDHNSFTWGIDENVSVNGWVKNITISNNIIAEGLTNSIHPKGEHSKGLLISNWDGTTGDRDSNITITKNLFASNTDRNPTVRAGQGIEIVNNYVYNFGNKHDAIYVGGGTAGSLVTSASIIGNVIEAGPNTASISQPVGLESMGAGSAIFLKDNIVLGANGAAIAQSQSALTFNYGGQQYATTTGASFASSDVSVLNANSVKAHVLANAGASQNDRDAIDARIVQGAATHTGTMVNSVAKGGGYTANPLVKAAADTDKDGMPNWFEDIYGLSSTVANANGDSDQDGYTNIEEYINGLISGFNLARGLSVQGVTAAASVADHIPTGQPGLQYVVVDNFKASEGDRLELAKLLPNFDPARDNLSDYVEFVTVGKNTFVSVDTDGLGNASVMRIVAELRGVDYVANLSDLVEFTPVQPPVVPSEPPVVPSEPPVVPVVTYDPLIASNDLFVAEKGLRTLISASDLAANDEGGRGALEVVSVGDATHGTVAIDQNGVVSFTADAGFTGRASFNYVVADDRGEQTTGHADLLVYRSVTGTAGVDKITIAGSEWANVKAGDGNDQINAGGGDDILDGGAGADIINSGAGDDLMLGGAGADVLNGGAGADVIDGGADNDSIKAGAGNDIVFGGDGNDLIMGEAGNNQLSGGSGTDTITGGSDSDVIDGGADADKIAAGAGNDLAFGGTGDDTVNGEAGNDDLYGNEGNDKLDGGADHDRLFGGDGNDTLTGGLGNDWLSGGAGDDRLTGGVGADAFAFESPNHGYDTIVDFVRGEDRVVINGAAFGMAAFTLDNLIVGANAKASTAGPTLLYDTKSFILSFDADGSGSLAAAKLAVFGNRAALDTHDFTLV